MKRFIFGMFATLVLAGFCVSAGCEKNEVEVKKSEVYAPRVVEQHEVVVP